MSSSAQTADEAFEQAEMLLDAGQPEEALAVLQDAVARFPFEGKLHAALMAIFRAMDRPIDALRAGVTWYRRAPTSPECLESLSNVAAELGRSNEAEKWALEAERLRYQQANGEEAVPALLSEHHTAPRPLSTASDLPVTSPDAGLGALIRDSRKSPPKPAPRSTGNPGLPSTPSRVTPAPASPPRQLPPPEPRIPIETQGARPELRSPPETPSYPTESSPELRPPWLESSARPVEPPTSFASFDRFTAETGATPRVTPPVSTPASTPIVASVVHRCASESDLERLVGFVEGFARTYKDADTRLMLCVCEPKDLRFVDRLRARIAAYITGATPKVGLVIL